jgi:hypothetical protein
MQEVMPARSHCLLKHCDGQGSWRNSGSKGLLGHLHVLTEASHDLPFEQMKFGNFEFEISMDDVKMWFGDGQGMHMCAFYILG